MATSRFSRVVTIAVIALMSIASSISNATAQSAPTVQPTQPSSGPGSSEHRFTATKQVRIGDQPTGAWIFFPEAATIDELNPMPVVLFVHGFTAVDPQTYQGWIEHLVMRGTIVIYPDFQTLNPLQDGPETYIPNLFTGIRSALVYLEGIGVTDIRTCGLHVIGHSLGGILAVRYAQDAERLGFPKPRTLTVVEPGGCSTCGNYGPLGVPLELDRPLAPDLYVQVMVGIDDATVGDADARSIWPLLKNVPVAQRDYVTIVTDLHGEPPMVADHEMVGTGGARGTEDAMDWFALWRPTDALIACDETGTLCSTAIGNTPEHRNMGIWSDGTPVSPLRIMDGPG